MPRLFRRLRTRTNPSRPAEDLRHRPRRIVERRERHAAKLTRSTHASWWDCPMCLRDAPTADPPVDARRTPGPVEVGQAKFSLEHLDPMAASGAGECPARTSVCAVDRAACPRAAHLAANSARGSRTRVYCSGAAPVAWGPADLRPWPADLHAFERIRVPRVEPRPPRGSSPLCAVLHPSPADPRPCRWSRTLAWEP